MEKVELYLADLSTETLTAIRNDLAPYSSLRGYIDAYELLCEYIEAREKKERKEQKK